MVRIHINRHVVASNAKHGRADPPISVVKRGKTTRVSEVEILGPARVVYRPDRPLSCGARVWIECMDVAVADAGR